MMKSTRIKAIVLVLAVFVEIFFIVGFTNGVRFFLRRTAVYWHTDIDYSGYLDGLSMQYYAGIVINLILCPLSIIVAEEYTIWKVLLFGGLVELFGAVVAIFFTKTAWFLTFFDVIQSISFSCTVGNILILIAKYFNRRGTLTMAVLSLGARFSPVILHIVLRSLTKNYSWDGVMLIISGLYLHTIPCALLVRLIVGDSHQLVKEYEEEQRIARIPIDTRMDSTSERLPVVDDDHGPSTFQDESHDHVQETRHQFGRGTHNMDESLTKKERGLQMASKWISVFGNYLSLYFILLAFLWSFGHRSMVGEAFVIIVEYGIDLKDKALSATGYVVGLLVTGVLGDLKRIQRYKILASSSLLASINLFLFPLTMPISWLVSCQVFLFGMSIGCCDCLFVLVCFDFLGPTVATKTLAFALPARNVASVLRWKMYEFMLEQSGSFTSTWMVCGAFYLVGAVMLFFLPIIARLEDSHREKKGRSLTEETIALS